MGRAWIAILDHVLFCSASTEVAGLAGAKKAGCGLVKPIQACATVTSSQRQRHCDLGAAAAEGDINGQLDELLPTRHPESTGAQQMDRPAPMLGQQHADSRQNSAV